VVGRAVSMVVDLAGRRVRPPLHPLLHSYVEFLRKKSSSCDPGSKMDDAVGYILQCDRNKAKRTTRQTTSFSPRAVRERQPGGEGVQSSRRRPPRAPWSVSTASVCHQRLRLQSVSGHFFFLSSPNRLRDKLMCRIIVLCKIFSGSKYIHIYIYTK